MTLSRTARILIAVLLLAAAAFFWVNFFSREQSSPAATVTTTAPRAPKATNGTAKAKTATSKATTKATTKAATKGTTKAATQPAKPAAGTQATTKGAPVVVPSRPAVATHDLQVAELPFLVTQPPQPNTSETTGTSSQPTAAPTNQVSASAKRMTVNPFSPILIRAPVARTAPKPPPKQTVTTQRAPTPAKQQPLAEAPTPQPIAPPPPQASNLPGATPTGMLPTTPGVLQSTRVQVQAQNQPPAPTPAPTDLGTVAAVREPGSGGGAQLGNVNNPGMLSVAPAVPGLLGPGQPTKPPKPTATTTAAANGNGNAPLQAGTDSLSLYLRDHNVRFTGTVLGPVSVGVFRSDLYKAPVVVSLGQELPETKITLTDLRGHEAVFTYQTSTQSLSLDLRR